MMSENRTPQPLRPGRKSCKAAALARLKKLEGRSVTVGRQLDELRAILTLLLEQMPG